MGRKSSIVFWFKKIRLFFNKRSTPETGVFASQLRTLEVLKCKVFAAIYLTKFFKYEYFFGGPVNLKFCSLFAFEIRKTWGTPNTLGRTKSDKSFIPVWQHGIIKQLSALHEAPPSPNRQQEHDLNCKLYEAKAETWLGLRPCKCTVFLDKVFTEKAKSRRNSKFKRSCLQLDIWKPRSELLLALAVCASCSLQDRFKQNLVAPVPHEFVKRRSKNRNYQQVSRLEHRQRTPPHRWSRWPRALQLGKSQFREHVTWRLLKQNTRNHHRIWSRWVIPCQIAHK